MRSDLALVLLSKAQVENKHILFLFKATFIFVIFMLRKILLVTEESKIIGLFFLELNWCCLHLEKQASEHK